MFQTGWWTNHQLVECWFISKQKWFFLGKVLANTEYVGPTGVTGVIKSLRFRRGSNKQLWRTFEGGSLRKSAFVWSLLSYNLMSNEFNQKLRVINIFVCDAVWLGALHVSRIFDVVCWMPTIAAMTEGCDAIDTAILISRGGWLPWIFLLCLGMINKKQDGGFYTLLGGLKYFLFSTLLGEVIKFD